MALSGKFIADFESFYGAVQKAEVSLRSFEGGAGKVETSLNRVANGLSGTRLIQDATIAAEAVERIGGVSKLTEAELSRLSAQAKEAAAKMVAMGTEVPPGIQRIADAAKSAGTQLSEMKSFALAAAGAFGVAFSVGAVVQFGKSVFDSAGQINDLSEKMGVSTDAVQGFKAAAELAGSSLDTVGTAITKMNVNLAEGDKGTVKALKDAGLGFSAIRNMKPEEAFLAITDAIQKIEDPMVQTSVALKLFGKSAGDLLPAIKEGFRGAADGAAKMSEDTIKSLEAAGDAWSRLGTRVTIVSGNIIAAAMDTASQTTKSWKDFAMFAENTIKFGAGAAAAMATAQAEAERAGKSVKDVYLGTGGAVRKTTEELEAAAAAAKQHAREIASLADKYMGLNKTVSNLAEVMKKMKPSDDWKGLAEDIGKLSREGAKLTPEMTQLAIAFGTLGPAVKIGADGIADLGFKIDIALPKLSGFNQAMDDLQAKTKWGWEGVTNIGFKASDGFKEGAKELQKFNKELEGMGSEIAAAFSGGGGFVNGLKNLGTDIAKNFTSTVLSFVPGIGPLLSQLGGPIVDGVKKLFGGLFGSAGRDLVKDFAASFGGFDALQSKLSELGAEGQRLWIALTQGVGRNNPDQARAAVEAVTAALDAQKSKAAEAAQAAADNAGAQVEAQQSALDAITARYTETISKLDSEYKALNDSVSKEAEEAVMGVAETQERARMEQIKAEKAAQEAMRDAEIAAKKFTFEQWYKDGAVVNEDLRTLFGKPLEIPYYFKAQNSPDGGGATYAAPASGSARGGAAAMTVPVILQMGRKEVGRQMVQIVPGLLTGAGR